MRKGPGDKLSCYLLEEPYDIRLVERAEELGARGKKSSGKGRIAE